MTYTETQARVMWVGRFTRCEGGALGWTTSSFTTTRSLTPTEAWDTLASRESWLPHDGIDRRNGEGGWRLQEVNAVPALRQVCSRCGDTGCGGPTNPHE